MIPEKEKENIKAYEAEADWSEPKNRVASLLHGFWADITDDRTCTVPELADAENFYAEVIVDCFLSAVRDGLSFELIEEIAALEHEQWMEWSKHVAGEVSPERRARWEAYWIPYERLSEEVKEHDRIWARKIIALAGTGKEEK